MRVSTDSPLIYLSPGWTRFREYPYYDWDNSVYENFMIDLLRSLEVRSFEAKEIIIGELEECNEILFVQQGSYNIGYEINKVVRFRMQFGPRSIIGGFNLCFDKRNFFIYKAHSRIKGMAIRKMNWHNLMQRFPKFERCLDLLFLDAYDWKIRRPLMRRREKEINQIRKRKDFSQMLVIEEKDDN